MNANQVLSIIPARGGSKGLPGKNIRIISGKHLISWTIEESLKSRYITRTVVSTEDDQIGDITLKSGAELIKRPMDLAQDNSTTADVIFHVLNSLEKDSGYKPDYIVLLQCTSPLRSVAHIDEAFEIFLKNESKADSLISVCKEEHPPFWLKTTDSNNFLKDFLDYDKEKFKKRQDFPQMYRINGGIYISSLNRFIENKGFQSPCSVPYLMDRTSSIDIDDETDFLFAEFLMNRRNI